MRKKNRVRQLMAVATAAVATASGVSVMVASPASAAECEASASQNSTGWNLATCDIPDIDQLRDALPRQGVDYCAPVAAANALFWLDKHGYPNLIEGEPQGVNTTADRHQTADAIETIAAYMGTNPNGGTNVDIMPFALETYFQSRGYGSLSAEYTSLANDVQPGRTLSNLLAGSNGQQNMAIAILTKWKDGVKVGGHVVALTGTKGLTNGSSNVTFHDPESDDLINQQSPVDPRTHALGPLRVNAGPLLIGMKGFRDTGDTVHLQGVIVIK
ncbi:hypothetical protein ACIOMM_36375 [Streptomyces sp. NPDC087908]|uniref:hypothetical protein n=1 Tax=Streptomyces sp. NPDC087908 TaxID=3365820 RepID=UPI00381735AD